jgi:hypothetical protein
LHEEGTDEEECEENFAIHHDHNSVFEVGTLNPFILYGSYMNNSHVPKL